MRKVLLISIHPSRVGWDAISRVTRKQARNFNPPIPCGMGRIVGWRISVFLVISIHPSRVGWDLHGGFFTHDHRPISIHPSRVGWDSLVILSFFAYNKFQSTHPVWDGTLVCLFTIFIIVYFNPPIPCGMGLWLVHIFAKLFRISIHPSRVGWDATSPLSWKVIFTFQSTHPVWDGTSLQPSRS